MERALRYELNLARAGLQRLGRRPARLLAGGSVRLHPYELPEKPGPDWLIVRPRVAGICGSDVGVLTGHSSPYLAPLTGLPAYLGHEIVGAVDEANGPWPRGTRVVVRPTLACRARGLEACRACAAGLEDLCERRDDSGLGPGTMLGYHGRLPGGWSTALVAPSYQLYPVPEAVDDFTAVLTEPLAIVLAAIRQADWPDVRRTLVIGAGTVGLLTTFALTLRGEGGEVWQTARHEHQARLARNLGARPIASKDIEEWAGAARGRPLFGAPPYFPWGADLTVDTVGSPASFLQALAVTRPGGQVLLVGGLGAGHMDLAPAWTRRLQILGAWGYGPASERGFETTLEMLQDPAGSRLGSLLVTHAVPLSEWRRALALLFASKREAIKVVLTNRTWPS
jgi:threonine dehydrogenase-like Zn-dependent dehydrogenase